ncbi:hypothetical protein NZA98_07285, partial [Escherichia coli]|nr:hypothetical protein [Escherichia coli]
MKTRIRLMEKFVIRDGFSQGEFGDAGLKTLDIGGVGLFGGKPYGRLFQRFADENGFVKRAARNARHECSR